MDTSPLMAKPNSRSDQTVDHAISGLSDDELRLLNALATEPNLTAVAQAMSLSTRHTRRKTTELLNRMGANSIRAAVAIAAARGLINEPPAAPCASAPRGDP